MKWNEITLSRRSKEFLDLSSEVVARHLSEIYEFQFQDSLNESLLSWIRSTDVIHCVFHAKTPLRTRAPRSLWTTTTTTTQENSFFLSFNWERKKVHRNVNLIKWIRRKIIHECWSHHEHPSISLNRIKEEEINQRPIPFWPKNLSFCCHVPNFDWHLLLFLRFEMSITHHANMTQLNVFFLDFCFKIGQGELVVSTDL